MKIKNMLTHAMYVGYKGIRPGFTLAAGQTSHDLPPAVYHNLRLRADSDRQCISTLLNDADRRFLGLDKTSAPVVEDEPEPAVEEEPEVEEQAVEEDNVPEEVSVEEEVTDEEVVVEEDEPQDYPEDEPVAEDELEDEPVGVPAFELPKAGSKMNKADWMKVGLTEQVGLRNEINLSMTKGELRTAVEARLTELGLI